MYRGVALCVVSVRRNGDEVIIPALTFVADANVVMNVGAKPVLADSCSTQNLNVSIETIRQVKTKKTKAVIVVHFAGFPCEDIIEIKKYCIENNLYLIEDVAHAPGAKIDGFACGTIGDIGCFSFFSNKNLSIGEGGMAVTSSKSLDEKLRRVRSHGMSALTLDRHLGRAITYDVSQVGLNYRIDEIRAALGLVQLQKLEASNMKRKIIFDYYCELLSNTSVEIPFRDIRDGIISAYHIMPILLPKSVDRLKVIGALKEKKIQTSIHYPPFWNFSRYEGMFSKKSYPVIEDVTEREITLPLYPDLTMAEVEKICFLLKEEIDAA